MKLKLSIILLSSLMGGFVAQAVEIPNDYKHITLKTSSNLKNYTSNSESDKYAFFLGADVTFTPTSNTTWTDSTPLITGGNLVFTSEEGSEARTLNFRSGTSTIFEQPSSLTFNNLRKLSLSTQTVNTDGGAIDLGEQGKLYVHQVNDGDKSTDDVVISSNTTSAKRGGAINAQGAANIIDISHNGNIAIRSNSATSSYQTTGGAIYSTGTIDFNSNENITFYGNSAYCPYSTGNAGDARGGAIYSSNVVNISNNADVNFTKNYAYASYMAYGGAIYTTNIVNINNNGDVSFIDNYATAKKDKALYFGFYYSNGGAIYSTEDINITNNANVIFKGNYASASSNLSTDRYNVDGGAIYSTGAIVIVGNESVTFEQNYVIQGNIINNNCIYLAPDSSSDKLILAAKTGGHITFYDSVFVNNYSGATISLNADYQDSEGINQKAGGNIVFSGSYCASDLLNTVNLYGGTLSIEDKAILKTYAINIAGNSNATLKILDATVNSSGYSVNINSSGQLHLGGTAGSGKLTASSVNVRKGATLSVENTVTDAASVITLAAAESISIFNEKLGGTIIGNLNLAAGAAYKADGAHLSITSGTLTFNSTATDKINLILTLGAEYNEDSKVLLFTDVSTVKFVLDNITATKTGQSITLNAADYFGGEWINENTLLIYEGGNVYLTGVNRVIPEPTTATLSLFALAGLAMRRRRRK